jgi:hypothetical protein
MSLPISQSKTAAQLSQAIQAAATPTTTAPPTTTIPPMGLSDGKVPSSYTQFVTPNPDRLQPHHVFEGGPGGSPNQLYYIQRKTLPPPGSNPRSGGAVGWTAILRGGTGLPANKIFKAQVVYHAPDGKSEYTTPGPIDKFGFSPDPPLLEGNHQYSFSFAPTPTGGRRRSKRRKGRKGRKGTRRH